MHQRHPHVFVDASATYLYWKEDSNAHWPVDLAELLAEHPSLIRKLYVDEQDQRTASLAVTLWPWVRGLEPMERARAQGPLIESVTLNFAPFRTRLTGLIESETNPAIRMMAGKVLD